MNSESIVEPQTAPLPWVLAGPILRKTLKTQVVVWLATSRPMTIECQFSMSASFSDLLNITQQLNTLKISDKLYIHCINCLPESALATEQLIYYDVLLKVAGEPSRSIVAELPYLLYAGADKLHFFVAEQINQLFFGSCRNPHYASQDALTVGDTFMGQYWQDLSQRPSMLIHGGDQVYVDDVAGPMLNACHQLIEILGLPKEQLPDGGMGSGLVGGLMSGLVKGEQLYFNAELLYQRSTILPIVLIPRHRLTKLFSAQPKREAIFTSVKLANHLITMAEVIAMYLLVWSPQAWSLLGDQFSQPPAHLSAAARAKHLKKYGQEAREIQQFRDGLTKVSRLLAHVPNYMIFDDHDVTDDWNISKEWQQNVEQNPLARRIVNNAIVGYWLFQGWGNDPDKFDSQFIDIMQQGLLHQQPAAVAAMEQHIADFDQWQYTIAVDPVVIVLNTRTHRWPLDHRPAYPSGLMDAKRLNELEQQLVAKEHSIIVSAAPIFGVKIIETIQRVATMLGWALAVDAENWMAHRAAAKKLLDIFKRIDTPSEIVVLSGDVHYSFCFHVNQRFKDNATDIWQLTCSGFKNEFPRRSLANFERLERWLFFPKSPLNIFTRRRGLEIDPLFVKAAEINPPQRPTKQMVVSQPSLGLVKFKDKALAQFDILVDVQTDDDQPEVIRIVSKSFR